MNLLILAAGQSKPFEEKGYVYPKYLTEIIGKPLIEHVVSHLPIPLASKHLFVIGQEQANRFYLDDVIRLLIPDSEIIMAENTTRGAACSALLAIETINTEEELLIANGDIVVTMDVEEAIRDFRKRKLEGGIVTFYSVHPRWSYVKLDNEGWVVEAAEKKPISKHATVGLYYFKHGCDFVDAAKEMIRKDAHVDGLYYVCPCYNSMILKQARIGTYQIPEENYFPLATPQGVQQFEEHLRALNKGKVMG